MNPFLHVLSSRELNDIFLKETRRFMMALKYNVSPEELQKIRDNIIEIACVLKSREPNTIPREKDNDQQNVNNSR